MMLCRGTQLCSVVFMYVWRLQVFEKLHLTSPKTCDGSLMITPDTTTQLRTNRSVGPRHTPTCTSVAIDVLLCYERNAYRETSHRCRLGTVRRVTRSLTSGTETARQLSCRTRFVTRRRRLRRRRRRWSASTSTVSCRAARRAASRRWW